VARQGKSARRRANTFLHPAVTPLPLTRFPLLGNYEMMKSLEFFPRAQICAHGSRYPQHPVRANLQEWETGICEGNKFAAFYGLRKFAQTMRASWKGT
jgi:hypothetical protein